VAPGDVSALAHAIKTLFASPEVCARFGAAGRRRAEGEFGMSRMIEAYERLYTQMIAVSNRASPAAQEGVV